MTSKNYLSAATALSMLVSVVALNAAAQDAQIHIERIATTQEHWSVNSFIVESGSGIVIVDGLLLNSDVDKLAAVIASKNKPVLGLLVTHAHPDHVLGIPKLQERFGQFPVFGTQHMSDIVASQVAQFKAGPLAANWSDDVWKGDAPVIDSIVTDGQILTLGGIEIFVEDTGVGEAESTAVYAVPAAGALFSGDILMPFHHYYVGEGKAKEVIAQLDHLASEYSDVAWVYPGHGEIVSPSFFMVQKHYVETMRDEYIRLHSDPANVNAETGGLTREANRMFGDYLMQAFPGYQSFGLNPYMFAAWNAYGLAQQFNED